MTHTTDMLAGMKRLTLRVLVSWLALGVFAASGCDKCEVRDPGSGECLDRCIAIGVRGPCASGPDVGVPRDVGLRDSGTDAPTDTAPSIGPPPPAAFQFMPRFIDAFEAFGGLLVVDEAGVRLFAEDALVAEYASERPLRSATFDEVFVISDGAELTVLDSSLAVVAQSFLRGPCDALLVLDEGSLICDGHFNRDAAELLSIDTGEVIASTAARILSRDSFFQTRHAAPGRRWYLRSQLVELDERFWPVIIARFSGENPYLGGILLPEDARERYVRSDGQLLELSDCAPAESPCLEVVSRVNGLPAGDQYVALDANAQTLVGVYQPGGRFRDSGPHCGEPCALQWVDPSFAEFPRVTEEAFFVRESRLPPRVVALGSDRAALIFPNDPTDPLGPVPYTIHLLDRER